MRFRNSKPPVEIAGYVHRQRWVVDIIRGTANFKWYSVINDNYSDDEELPWFGETFGHEPPF